MTDRGSYRLPAVVTHIYDPGRGPFRNRCDLADEEAASVLDEIGRSGRRTIKPNYLARRRATEAWLRKERARRFGPACPPNPVYSFLGDVADGADPSRPCSLVMPLSRFDPSIVTFTYPDSMASFLLGFRRDLAEQRLPHHGKLFTLPEIEALVASEGLPGDRWRHDPVRRHDRFIEMQLWDKRSLTNLEQTGQPV